METGGILINGLRGAAEVGYPNGWGGGAIQQDGGERLGDGCRGPQQNPCTWLSTYKQLECLSLLQ